MLFAAGRTRESSNMAVMVIELYKALKEAGASEQKAQAAAQAMADHNTRFDKLESKVETGFAEVTAQITMLKWMNGIVIGGVAALIIKTFFA
jgi:tetrahydromethanopterin S-methyltransferase subunit G